MMPGVAHDISASGLSCSTSEDWDSSGQGELKVMLNLSENPIELKALKILQRNFNEEVVHVLKFTEDQKPGTMTALFDFIYKALDRSMAEFIKNLSN